MLNQQILPARPRAHAERGLSNVFSFPRSGLAQPVRHLAAGQALFHEGDPSNWLYEVVGGMLKLSKVTSDGRMLIVDFLVPGDLASLSDVDHYRCTAQAIGETTVCALPRSLLESTNGSDMQMMQRLLRHACRREEALHEQLLLMCMRHPHQRIAAFLLAMAERQSPDMTVCDGSHVALPMTRRDIADHLALAQETLSRVMRRLREQGLIAVHHCHDIELRDIDGLADLIAED